MKIILLILLLLPCFILSQTSFEYKVGKPYEPATYYYTKETFLDPETGNIMHIRERTIEIIDGNTLVPIKSGTLEDIPKRFLYSASVMLNKKLYFCYEAWDKKTCRFYAREVDFKTGQFNGSAKMLFESTKLYSGIRAYSNVEKDKLIVRAITAREKEFRNYETMEFHVFDAELNPLASEETRMPYTEGKMNLIESVIIDQKNRPALMDQNNNLIFLAKVRSEESGNGYKESDDYYHLEIFRFNLETKSIQTTIIKADQNQIISIKGVRLFIDHNKVLKCAGFYSKNPKVDLHLDKRLWGFRNPESTPSADGIFVFEIDSDNNVKKKFHEIPLDIITQHEASGAKGYYEKNQDKAELRLLSLKGLSLNEDNSFVLLGEQRYITTDSKGSNETYFTDDVLATKIDSNGDIVWMSKIPKRGEVSSSFYKEEMSFLNTENKIYLFSWDNPANLKLTTSQDPATYYHESACFIACCIDKETGKYEKKIVFSRKEKKNGYELSPLKIQSIEPITENSVMITLPYDKKSLHVIVGIKSN